MVPDGTSTGCARHTVLPRDVSSNATDHRTLCTARRLRVACNNQAHNHQPAEKFDVCSLIGRAVGRTAQQHFEWQLEYVRELNQTG